MNPIDTTSKNETPASVPASAPTSWREAKLSTFKIECPPVWVARFIVKIPQTNDQFRKDPVAYLKARAGRREFRLPHFEAATGNDNDNLEEPGTDDMIISLEQWLCTKLCVSALALNMKLSGWSNRLRFEVTEALKMNRTKISEDHYRVIQYFLDSMPLSVTFLKENLSSDKMEKFQGEWEKDIKTSALVSFCKGIIASLLGLVHDVTLGHFRNAVKTEPNCHLWQHILGEKLKHMRVSGGGKQNMPSSEELGACQKAHELCPENVKYMLDLTALKLQKLNGSGSGGKAVKELEGILKLLGMAVERSPENSRCEMLAKLKMAEVYTATDCPQRTAEAKQILTECYRKWPKCSMVLHKVGKFYHYITKDYATANRIYGEALQASSRNYPCLMDYLCLLGRHLKKYKEMGDVIDRCLEVIQDVGQKVNLLIIKGKAYWHLSDKQNKMKEAACEVWMLVFTNYEHLAFKVKESLSAKSTKEFGHLEVSLNEVALSLKGFCLAKGIPENKPLKALLEVLNQPKQSARGVTGTRGGNNSNNDVRSSRRIVGPCMARDTTVYDLFCQQLNSKKNKRK